jgi:hypothetical protein
MAAARGQRLAGVLAKRLRVTFPGGTGRAGQQRSGLLLTVRWDGRAWKRVPIPGGDHLTSPQGGYLNGAAAVSADDAWAVGAGMFDRALIERWDGAAWTRVPSPDPGGGTVLNGVAARPAGSSSAVLSARSSSDWRCSRALSPFSRVAA